MPGEAFPPAGVLGGAMLKADDYASFLAREYLSEYLPAGGAAIKVAVVGDASAADRLESTLAAETAGRDGLFVSVSAESVRVHMIDQIFFAISRAIAWDDLAADCVRAAYEGASFPVPDGAGLAVARIARHHDVDVPELYRSVRRLLERNLLGSPVIAPEMGRAMLRLSQAHLGSGDVDASEREAVLAWLRGDLRSVAALRPALIYSRIGRHNARSMLASAAALLAARSRVLVVSLDLARLAEGRRPPAPVRTGLYYSKAAVLDAYEVLRQFIDATDELRGVLVLAVVPPELTVGDDPQPPAMHDTTVIASDSGRTIQSGTCPYLSVCIDAIRS